MPPETILPLEITATDNGFILLTETGKFILEWMGDKLLVTGPDTCYYLVETVRGLEHLNCLLSSTSTLLLPN